MASVKYVLGERIAQGGMAEIYLGKIIGSEGFARICAFKKILPQFASDAEFVQMFKQEADVAKQLQNKNIVQVHDFVNEPGQGAMLVMEYVDGQDLRSILRETERAGMRIPIELAVYICAEVLSGLAYAHSAIDYSGRSLGIIHRDISPQNILISYEGDVKITDFGIAKVQSSANVTRAGVLKGKFRYMSPEQASGLPVDARTDIFAVGIILYEMLTMSRLFKGEDDMQILNAVRECKIKSPNEVRGTQIPAELESIVFKFLQKDPKNRYQTARDAAKDLTRFLYAYRPDFFPGELSDYMQKLFSAKIETTRERIRSTLALPIDTLQHHGSGEPASLVSGAMSMGGHGAWTGGPHEGVFSSSPLSTPPQSAFTGLGHVSVVKNISSGSQNPGSAGGVNAELQRGGNNFESVVVGKRSGTYAGTVRTGKHGPIPKHLQQVRHKNQAAKSSLWPMVFIGLGVVLTLALGGVWAVKKKYVDVKNFLDLSSSLTLLPSVTSSGVQIFINNQVASECVKLPCTLKLEPNREYVVVAKKRGFRDFVVQLKTPFYPPLHRKESVVLEGAGPLGDVQIITVPPGASVVLEDGMYEAKAGDIISWIPLGFKYKLRIEHPRCQPLDDVLELPQTSGSKVIKRYYTLLGCSN